ncbi:DUF421 domain-containing protein [Staphylospora marina]|uniref:DUF421 domain-containing protein n=1 Tax=Staphylospora marina TaxID=2490858 RepID=UPI001F149FE8|nr:DUF421 domain-containing protein [Staphylospora marina]
MFWSMMLRAIFLYFLLMLVLRLMGKREIGKLSIFDLIVSFMIADLSAMAIERTNEPLVYSVAAILMLAGLQILLSYVSLKSTRIRRLFDGEPLFLIRDGKIMNNNMAQARYTMDDLLQQLREKNIADVADVEFAILENNGKLSVFPKQEKRLAAKEDVYRRPMQHRFRMPVPLIIEGKVQENGLRKIGQTRFWLKNEIRKRGFSDFRDVFYASLSQDGILYVDGKNDDE